MTEFSMTIGDKLLIRDLSPDPEIKEIDLTRYLGDDDVMSHVQAKRYNDCAVLMTESFMPHDDFEVTVTFKPGEVIFRDGASRRRPVQGDTPTIDLTKGFTIRIGKRKKLDIGDYVENGVTVKTSRNTDVENGYDGDRLEYEVIAKFRPQLLMTERQDDDSLHIGR